MRTSPASEGHCPVGETDDECDLPGTQGEDFPCSKEPVVGQDPWQGQPDCVNRTVSSGYRPWSRAWTFVADPEGGSGSWVLGDKVYGQTVVTGTRDATLQECPPPPDMDVMQTAEGCEPGFGLPPGAWTRQGVQEYVLDGTTWVLEPEADIAWGDWEGTAMTDEELVACAETEPAQQVRTMSGGRESCRLGGVVAWTDTWTTDWVLDTETLEWELGTEVGPVRDREFTPYTEQQLEALGCVEVAGEQAEVIDHEAPDVPGAAGVPGAVNAGVGGSEPTALWGHGPWWLLAVGGGVGLIGAAGWRRRATAVR